MLKLRLRIACLGKRIMAKFNPVAKFQRKFNKAVVMKDRKREWKKVGARYNRDDDFYDSAGDKDEYIRTGQLPD